MRQKRQILFSEKNAGKEKGWVAVRKRLSYNPDIEVRKRPGCQEHGGPAVFVGNSRI
jgi:molybdopterin/thiamine biosynthesis adenylyltransferase